MSKYTESGMTKIKYNRVAKLSTTARFPRTFAARLGNIPPTLRDQLTAAQIAAIIDGPMQRSHDSGFHSGYRERD